MTDWHFGVLTTLIALPLYATWLSGGKVSLLQRGIGEPFFIGFLGGITIVIASAVTRDWTVWSYILAFIVGIAVVVLIVKSVKGTLSREAEQSLKEDEEE